MKEKIFNKMYELGWNVNNLEDVFYYHLERLDKTLNTMEDNTGVLTEKEEVLMEDLQFITDFLHQLDDLDEEMIKND